MRAQVLLSEDRKQLSKLTEANWDWKPCEDCISIRVCTIDGCPGRRYNQFGRYLQFCRAVIQPIQNSTTAHSLGEHIYVLNVIKAIRLNPDATREELEKLVSRLQGSVSITPVFPPTLVNNAVRIMTMINCASDKFPGRLEKAESRMPWGSKTSITEYLEHVFTMTTHPILSDPTTAHYLEFKEDMKATSLKKRLGITFRGTSDIRDHLRFDRRSNILEVYHHAAFLKEQLRLTKTAARELTVTDGLKLGALPRQLVLETLDSLESILFPLAQKKPRRLLETLISEDGWDLEILHTSSERIVMMERTLSLITTSLIASQTSIMSWRIHHHGVGSRDTSREGLPIDLDFVPGLAIASIFWGVDLIRRLGVEICCILIRRKRWQPFAPKDVAI
ncbi:hypothetical protein BJ170DRAFT_736861 [Xylariales sp. AK1849]|nr:hypothetical protein BJ170DRAFT_736861 [Xylariales sp. AK1849]